MYLDEILPFSKEIQLSFPHQLPLAPLLGMKHWKLFLFPGWNFNSLDLVQIFCRCKKLLWVHIYNIHIISVGSFKQYSSFPSSESSVLPTSLLQWCFLISVFYMVMTQKFHLWQKTHHLLFSVVWKFRSLSINYCLLQSEVFLARNETIMNLLAQGAGPMACLSFRVTSRFFISQTLNSFSKLSTLCFNFMT